jgi:hypothetical protein
MSGEESESKVICGPFEVIVGEDVHCPENKADFWEYRGGSALEGKFPNNPRK